MKQPSPPIPDLSPFPSPSGDLSVTYTVSVGNAEPFTIGIYGSPGGSSYQPVELLQTYPVSDPSLLAVGSEGQAETYTVIFAADLGQLDTNCYLLADLDVYNNVRETAKTDNVSTLPASGVFQTGDGTVYVFTPATSADAVSEVLVTQNQTTGNVTVGVNGVNTTFSSVSGLVIGTPTGNNNVYACGVTVPLAIYGGAGSDWIVGGAGGDTIYGGAAGGSTIVGGSGGNTIYGGAAGGDTIVGGSGGNTIYGGAAGGSTINGGDGGDTIYTAAGGGDTIVGGSGNDTIYGQGTQGNTITDGSGNDTIYAGSGGDTITAGNGNDQVFGGSGDDTITVGNGNDWVQGGGGSDSIAAGTGNDWIYGGATGNTVLRAGVIDSTTPTIVPAENDVMAGAGSGVVLGGQLLDSTGGLRWGTVDYGDDSSANFTFYGSVFTAPSYTYAADGVYYASVGVTVNGVYQAGANYTVIVEDKTTASNSVGIVADKPDASKPDQTSGDFTVYWNNLSQAATIVVHLGGPAVVGTDYQPVGTSGPVPSGDTGEVITLPVSAGSGQQTYEIDPVGPGTGAGDTLLLADVALNTGPQQQQSVAFDYGGDLLLSPSAIGCEAQAVVAIHDPESVVSLVMYVRGSGPVDITGKTPSQVASLTVKIGQKIDLEVVVTPSPPENETLFYSWSVPGDVIADYQPTAPGDGPTLSASKLTEYEGYEGTTNPNTEFLWVNAPPSQVVTARVFSSTGRFVADVSASFDVQQPTYNLTPQPYNDPYPTVRGTIIVPRTNDSDDLAGYAGFEGTASGGWQYCFAQVIDESWQFFTVPPGLSIAAGTHVEDPPYVGLDESFWYGKTQGLGVFSSTGSAVSVNLLFTDYPGVRMYKGGNSYYSAAFSTWLLAQPVSNGTVDGDWVPLAEFQWNYVVRGFWSTTTPEVRLSVLHVNAVVPTQLFPSWTAVVIAGSHVL